MNEWLAAAPNAQLAHGMVGVRVSIADMADRPPRVLSDGEFVDIGGKRLRYIDTPHVPHGWDAGVIFEETTRTLFCGDLFAHFGNPPALTDGDIIGPAMAAENAVHQTSLGPTTAPTIRKLADVKPVLLATMHGASFSGDGTTALRGLADEYDVRPARGAWSIAGGGEAMRLAFIGATFRCMHSAVIGPNAKCRNVRSAGRHQGQRRHAANSAQRPRLTDSVEKVASRESLQICQNTNDIFY
jgi:hypothetical protein